MTVIQPPASPVKVWPAQPQTHPFGEQPCWADGLSQDTRQTLAPFLAAWAKYYMAASRLTGRQGLSASGSLRLRLSMIRASMECADLLVDVTQRARVAA